MNCRRELIKRSRLGICLFSLLILISCSSTEQEQAPVECRPATDGTCEADQGDDRGYDPCLINKNLPVCKD